jgi:hypothetical protein
MCAVIIVVDKYALLTLCAAIKEAQANMYYDDNHNRHITYEWHLYLYELGGFVRVGCAIALTVSHARVRARTISTSSTCHAMQTLQGCGGGAVGQVAIRQQAGV